MLDKEFITRKIKLIQEDLAKLESLGSFTFDAVAKLGVYSEDFAKEIAPSAGLRNRLIHEYNNTKDEIVYASVSNAIGQYAKYCDYVLKFLNLNKNSSK